MVSKRALLARKILEEEKIKHGGKCELCDSTENLEFHHQFETKLKGRGRGLPNRASDIRKNPLSYLLLCRPCHKAQHPDRFPVSVVDQVDDMEEQFLREHPEVQAN